MYRIGGLEPNDDDSKTIEIDGINYVVSDKFKTMLRDSFIDWGTFLEIYHDNLNHTLMFDQMVKLLGIKENENLRDFMIPLVEKIYKLPAEAHMACMMKQFVLFEPVSLAIHTLFTTIKLHYEHILELFLATRNTYILKNNLSDKPNDIESLKQYWSQMNQQYDLDSSSVMLLFLNPPNGLKSKINIKITGKEKTIDALRLGIKKFHYLGFCPKVPQVRLKALLDFPINEFVAAIKDIDPSAKFPNYNKLEKEIAKKMATLPEKPKVPDTYKRLTPPDTKDSIELAKWYVDAILDFRKTLLPYGAQFEDYYTEQAKVFIEINDLVRNEFSHRH